MLNQFSNGIQPSASLTIINMVSTITTVTMVFGFCVNILTLLTIVKNKSLQTPMNISLFNLAVADLCVCVIVLPLRLTLYNSSFIESSLKHTCRAEVFFKSVCEYAQPSMFVATSYERYQAVAKPFESKNKHKWTLTIMMLIWLFSTALSSTSVVLFHDGASMYPCSMAYDYTYIPVFREALIVLPFGTCCIAAVAVFYSLMMRTLHEHSKKMLKKSKSLRKNKVGPTQPEDAVRSKFPSDQKEQSVLNNSAMRMTKSNSVPLTDSNEHTDITEPTVIIIRPDDSTINHSSEDRRESNPYSTSASWKTIDASNHLNNVYHDSVLNITKNRKPRLSIHKTRNNICLLVRKGNRFPHVVRRILEENKKVSVRKDIVHEHQIIPTTSPICETVYTRQEVSSSDGVTYPMTTLSANGFIDTNDCILNSQSCLYSQNIGSIEFNKCGPRPSDSENSQCTSSIAGGNIKSNNVNIGNGCVNSLSDINLDNTHVILQPMAERIDKSLEVARNDARHSFCPEDQRNNEDCDIKPKGGNSMPLKELIPDVESESCVTTSATLEGPEFDDNQIQTKRNHCDKYSLMSEGPKSTNQNNVHKNDTVQYYRANGSLTGRASIVKDRTVVSSSEENKIITRMNNGYIGTDKKQITITYGSDDEHTQPPPNTSTKEKHVSHVSNNITKQTAPINAVISHSKNEINLKTRSNDISDQSTGTSNESKQSNVKSDDYTGSSGPSVTMVTEKTRSVDVFDFDGTVHKDISVDGSVCGAVCVMNPTNRMAGRRKVEMRAAKRIAVLIGTFSLVWLILPLTSAVISSKEQISSSDVEILMVATALSSLTVSLNPLLNLVLNKQMRSAAKTLGHRVALRCRKFR